MLRALEGRARPGTGLGSRAGGRPGARAAPEGLTGWQEVRGGHHGLLVPVGAAAAPAAPAAPAGPHAARRAAAVRAGIGGRLLHALLPGLLAETLCSKGERCHVSFKQFSTRCHVSSKERGKIMKKAKFSFRVCCLCSSREKEDVP